MNSYRIDFNRMTPEQLQAYATGGIPAVEALNAKRVGGGSGAAGPDLGYGAGSYTDPGSGYNVYPNATPTGSGPGSSSPGASPSLGSDLGYGVGSYADPGSGYNVYPNAIPTGSGPGFSPQGGAPSFGADLGYGAGSYTDPGSGYNVYPNAVPTGSELGSSPQGAQSSDVDVMRDHIAMQLMQQEAPLSSQMVSGSN